MPKGNVVGDPERYLMLKFIEKYNLYPFIHGHTIWDILVKHPGLRCRKFSPFTLRNHYVRYMSKHMDRLEVTNEVRQKFCASLVPRGRKNQNKMDECHPALLHDFIFESFDYPLNGQVW